MGRLKLKRTGLQQPQGERIKIGDSWILKKDYQQFLNKIHKEATKHLHADVMSQARLDTAEIQTNWLYAAFALGLRRAYHWGPTRIVRALHATDEVAGEIASMSINDIWDLVSKETNVEFRG